MFTIEKFLVILESVSFNLLFKLERGYLSKELNVKL